MTSLPNWLKFVNREHIEAHVEQGWRPLIPNAVMHHHEYGIEMGWFGEEDPPPFVPHRVPETSSPERRNGSDGT